MLRGTYTKDNAFLCWDMEGRDGSRWRLIDTDGDTRPDIALGGADVCGGKYLPIDEYLKENHPDTELANLRTSPYLMKERDFNELLKVALPGIKVRPLGVTADGYIDEFSEERLVRAVVAGRYLGDTFSAGSLLSVGVCILLLKVLPRILLGPFGAALLGGMGKDIFEKHMEAKGLELGVDERRKIGVADINAQLGVVEAKASVWGTILSNATYVSLASAGVRGWRALSDILMSGRRRIFGVGSEGVPEKPAIEPASSGPALEDAPTVDMVCGPDGVWSFTPAGGGAMLPVSDFAGPPVGFNAGGKFIPPLFPPRLEIEINDAIVPFLPPPRGFSRHIAVTAAVGRFGNAPAKPITDDIVRLDAEAKREALAGERASKQAEEKKAEGERALAREVESRHRDLRRADIQRETFDKLIDRMRSGLAEIIVSQKRDAIPAQSDETVEIGGAKIASPLRFESEFDSGETELLKAADKDITPLSIKGATKSPIERLAALVAMASNALYQIEKNIPKPPSKTSFQTGAAVSKGPTPAVEAQQPRQGIYQYEIEGLLTQIRGVLNGSVKGLPPVLEGVHNDFNIIGERPATAIVDDVERALADRGVFLESLKQFFDVFKDLKFQGPWPKRNVVFSRIFIRDAAIIGYFVKNKDIEGQDIQKVVARANSFASANEKVRGYTLLGLAFRANYNDVLAQSPFPARFELSMLSELSRRDGVKEVVDLEPRPGKPMPDAVVYNRDGIKDLVESKTVSLPARVLNGSYYDIKKNLINYWLGENGPNGGTLWGAVYQLITEAASKPKMYNGEKEIMLGLRLPAGPENRLRHIPFSIFEEAFDKTMATLRERRGTPDAAVLYIYDDPRAEPVRVHRWRPAKR